ncbi:MAG: SDR family NAD(P)-dependent oxidoreductase, partial [Actinomycetota bacterium]
GSLFQTTSEQIERVIKTNLLGPMWCTREILGLIDNAPRSGRTPTVVNVASMTGRLGLLGASDYAASRFGLVGFTEASWKELTKRGIRTMMVNSGWIWPGRSGAERIGGKRFTSWMIMDPARVAKAMVRGIERGGFEVRVQWWWHLAYRAAVLMGPLQRVVAKLKIKS